MVIVEADVRNSGLEVRAVVALSLPVPECWRDFGAGRANSVKARARDSGDLWSALTEFAPALRCHYPGQYELNSPIGDMYRAMIDASPSAVGPEFSVKIGTYEARKTIRDQEFGAPHVGYAEVILEPSAPLSRAR
jgi:hypothetical protein